MRVGLGGLRIKKQKIILKAFTNLASGNNFCKSSIRDLSRLVKNFNTPFSGGALVIGLVVSMTILFEKFSFPAWVTTFSAASPLTASTIKSANFAVSAKDPSFA